MRVRIRIGCEYLFCLNTGIILRGLLLMVVFEKDGWSQKIGLSLTLSFLFVPIAGTSRAAWYHNLERRYLGCCLMGFGVVIAIVIIFVLVWFRTSNWTFSILFAYLQ